MMHFFIIVLGLSTSLNSFAMPFANVPIGSEAEPFMIGRVFRMKAGVGVPFTSSVHRGSGYDTFCNISGELGKSLAPDEIITVEQIRILRSDEVVVAIADLPSPTATVLKNMAGDLFEVRCFLIPTESPNRLRMNAQTQFIAAPFNQFTLEANFTNILTEQGL